MTRYTITPRPTERDVLLQSDDRPTLLVCMRSEALDMPALEAEARRIAALLDGRAEAVVAAARRFRELYRSDDAPPCAHTDCEWCTLAASLAALDGER